MNSSQEKLLEIARSLIGIPYKYAAKPEDIPKFLDCSSFTQEIYKKIGIEIPRSTILQAATAGKEVPLNENLEIGDLLFFRGSKGHYDDELFSDRKIYIGHVAMYIGNNKIIHAASSKGVIEEGLGLQKLGPTVIVKRILN